MGKITQTGILYFGLALSIGLNLYEIFGTTSIGHCDDTNRYGPNELSYPAENIDETTAKDLILSYRREHDGAPTGIVISKRLIDAIFENTDRVTMKNTLAIDLINDPNDDNKPKWIISGKYTYETAFDLSPSGGCAFIAQTMCPNDCSQ